MVRWETLWVNLFGQLQFCSGNEQRSGSRCFGVNRGQAFSTQLVCGNPNVGVANRVHENLRGGELLGTDFEKRLMTFFAQEFVGGKECSAFIPVCKGVVHACPVCQLCGEPRGA